VIFFLLVAVAILFALNIGGSGLAPSFGAVMGAGILPERRARLLYLLCVVLGALLFGQYVARTLGAGILAQGQFTPAVALVILAASTAALLLANLLHIPQSTSWVTVFSIAAAAWWKEALLLDKITGRLLPAWIVLPILSFLLSAGLARLLYPMRRVNIRMHEYLTRHEVFLRRAAILSSCYVAVSIGANNVANVVGPLAGAGLIGATTGLLFVAPLVGLGPLLFPGPGRSVGREIVPLGLLSAVIVNLVTGSIIVAASCFGIPQSLVHVNTAAVAAISFTKEENWRSMRHEVLSRFGLIWFATPAIAAGLTIAGLTAAERLIRS
jgi:sulfate permease